MPSTFITKSPPIRRAFTLIELLVVMGILSVLLTLTLVAVNPAAQFQKANDTKRYSDVGAILNAINQFQSENNGQLPAGITTTAAQIGTGGAGMINLCPVLVPTYMASLPQDPLINAGTPIPSPCPASYATGYYVKITAQSANRITVYANNTQLASPTISISR